MQYNTTFRLETNKQLYEGVRYGFLELSLSSATATVPTATVRLTGLRLVVQAKPVNYRGSFHSPADPLLERVWCVAAWTVKANLLSDCFGSILMDRGDREVRQLRHYFWTISRAFRSSMPPDTRHVLCSTSRPY